MESIRSTLMDENRVPIESETKRLQKLLKTYEVDRSECDLGIIKINQDIMEDEMAIGNLENSLKLSNQMKEAAAFIIDALDNTEKHLVDLQTDMMLTDTLVEPESGLLLNKTKSRGRDLVTLASLFTKGYGEKLLSFLKEVNEGNGRIIEELEGRRQTLLLKNQKLLSLNRMIETIEGNMKAINQCFNPLRRIPQEIWEHIFNFHYYLSQLEFLSKPRPSASYQHCIGAVCRKWRRIFYNSSSVRHSLYLPLGRALNKHGFQIISQIYEVKQLASFIIDSRQPQYYTTLSNIPIAQDLTIIDPNEALSTIPQYRSRFKNVLSLSVINRNALCCYSSLLENFEGILDLKCKNFIPNANRGQKSLRCLQLDLNQPKAGSVEALLMWTLDITSLSLLGANYPRLFPNNPILLSQLLALEVNSHTFLVFIHHNLNMPALNNLTWYYTAPPDGERWRAAISYLGSTSLMLNSLAVERVLQDEGDPEMIITLVPLIQALPNLETLEFRGLEVGQLFLMMTEGSEVGLNVKKIILRQCAINAELLKNLVSKRWEEKRLVSFEEVLIERCQGITQGDCEFIRNFVKLKVQC